MTLANPWWVAGRVDVPAFRRPIVQRLAGRLQDPRVEILFGARQTGKTTVLLQVIESWIRGGHAPSSALYLPLDDPVWQEGAGRRGQVSLIRLLERWSEAIRRTVLRGGPPGIVVLDEVQHVGDWGRQVKSLHDHRLGIKVFVSGSSASQVIAGSAEALVGRSWVTEVRPLSFAEQALATGSTGLQEAVRRALPGLRAGLVQGLQAGRGAPAAAGFRRAEQELAGRASELRALMAVREERGGYPAALLQDLPAPRAWELLRTSVDLTLHRDLVRFFRVRDPSTAEHILITLAESGGGILSERGLASDLGIPHLTVRSHLRFLIDTRLVRSSGFYSARRLVRARTPANLHLADNGVMRALLRGAEPPRGGAIEGICAVHADALAADLAIAAPAYWRDRREVDLVLAGTGGPVPVEVKAGRARDRGGIEEFSARYRSRWSLTVEGGRGDVHERGGHVSVPLPLFLLAAGPFEESGSGRERPHRRSPEPRGISRR